MRESEETMTCKTALFAFIAGVFFSAAVTAAPGDMEGSRDYPLFPRFARFHIAGYEHNYDGADISLTADTKSIIKGNRYFLQYELDEDAAAPTREQIMDKYANLVLKRGGSVVFKGETSEGYKTATLRLPQNARRELWVIVLPFEGGQGYFLTIIEHDRFDDR
jgi:hypothetical protein